MITIKFKDQSVEVRQHPDNPELYCLNDIHKASGLTGKLTDLTKNLSEFKMRQYGVSSIKGKGKAQGTYANEMGVYWFSAKVDEKFEAVVFEAFKELANGNMQKATDISVSAVVTDEMKLKITEASKRVNAVIPDWDSKQEKQRGTRAYHCIWDHIVSKCVTGGSLKSIKDAHGVSSLADYFIKTGNTDGIGAYLAITKMLPPLLKAGVDYYVLKAAIVSQ